MTLMTFIFQICDSFVKGVQFLPQFLNFVLNWKAPSGKFINERWLFFTRYWQTFPLCAHGPSESRMRGYAILSRFLHESSTVGHDRALPSVKTACF